MQDLAVERGDEHAVVARVGDREARDGAGGAGGGGGDLAREGQLARPEDLVRARDRAAAQAPRRLGLGGERLDRGSQRGHMALAGSPARHPAVGVDEHQRRPGADRVGVPGDQIRVVEHRMRDAVARDRRPHDLVVALVGELGRVHADHHEHVGVAALELAQLLGHVEAVHAGRRPEVQQDDLAAQGSQRQAPLRRADPAAGADQLGSAHPRPGHHDRRRRRWRRARGAAAARGARRPRPVEPDRGHAALLEVDARAGEVVHDLREVGLVPDDQDAVVRAGRLEQRERLRPVEAARERRVVHAPRRRARGRPAPPCPARGPRAREREGDLEPEGGQRGPAGRGLLLAARASAVARGGPHAVRLGVAVTQEPELAGHARQHADPPAAAPGRPARVDYR